ncbi:C45 family autoproteolytic acyltransferase/hydolase [Flavilitoribacter nigricans]|uniref:Peptidase C45 hydrolase domain-containing protein n=1 Tax=Flavilitoribacter nigricans (strain ATCC 23147 / DSM 23189 / NBRC 102662 / NCIMB 1420 / SS-2) TaxID=1122177 RepID=A0A2D0N4W1_FLAN2|nr:C45 family autoproteolytic acyltransferase/hydolase [Flavilitoribacter nigricans]PHN03535.1 hypothetical protein CRP01_26415 [Flavilitoribacter nigricans DSM 23189 = NBRC 102662]
MIPEIITINLDLPARERWQFLADFKAELNALLGCYLNDLAGADFLFAEIGEYKHELIAEEYLEEIDCIAALSDYNPDEVLLANLYYDALKFYLGCTAFAVATEDQILHARNLDWWTDNNLLSKHSKIFEFTKDGQVIFKTVGWPGFIGALSGVKPGYFSLTLNAVSSKDPVEIATPVSFLLRDVLAGANSYVEAKRQLETTTIASDCLLLLAGTEATEMAVIERTPKRSAVRRPDSDFIAVTNDYKLIKNESFGGNELQATSCGRFERAEELLRDQIPEHAAACMKILQDDRIMMGITVQQMVFEVRSGKIDLIKT